MLGLRPTASRIEIEREGQKLLGMLELRLASAATYMTPVGVGVRTPDKVRRAMALLRDPDKRLSAEVWARLDPTPPARDAEDEDLEALAASAATDDPLAPFPDAMAAMGWAAGVAAPRGPRARRPS